MDIGDLRFIYYLGENEGAEAGFSYRLSCPISSACHLIDFVRHELFGDQEPESSMFKYDKYIAFVQEARKEPFDFEGALYGIADDLNDVGCQVCRVYTLTELMSKDDEVCAEMRNVYTGGASTAPVASDEKGFFFLHLVQDVCTCAGHYERTVASAQLMLTGEGCGHE